MTAGATEDYSASVNWLVFKVKTTKNLSPQRNNTKLENNLVWCIPCKDCDALNVGESGQKLAKKLNEHKSNAAGSKSPKQNMLTAARDTKLIGIV